MPDDGAIPTSILRDFYAEFREFRAESRARDERVDELLGEHHLTLYGDGNGKPGLRVRTDRLEQKHENLAQTVEDRAKNRSMHFWTLWAAALTGIGTAIASWFSRP